MKKTLVIILGALMVIMSGFNSADAVPVLTLSDGTVSVTITDNMAGDIDSTVGAMTFFGPVGSFNSNVTTGWTKPFIGSAAIPKLDLNSINASGAGTLTITFEEQGFAGLYNPGGFLTEIGGTAAGTISVFTEIKELGGVWTLIDSLGDYSGAFSGSVQSAWDPSEPYDLKITTVITHYNSGDSSSFNATLASVPEPGTLMLLGSGLVGFYYVRRKNMFSK